jgi:CRP/FNR family cyclic AMP-dependent transcriptional regulator
MPRTPPLEELQLFQRLSAEEREELASLMRLVSFAPGENIFEEGGPEESLYVLTSGTVEVHKKVLPRRRQHLATLRAPTVIGEMGLLTEPRAAATVTARKRVEGHALPREEFLERLEADSPAACKIIYELGRTLSERMAKTDESIARIITDLERAGAREARDFDVFQDRLIREWSF